MSLRLKTIIGIAIIEAVVLALLIVSALSWLKESNETRLMVSSQQLASVFANATRDAVIASDLAYLDSFAQSVVTEQNLAYIRITDRDANELALHGDYRSVNPNEIPSEVKDSAYDVIASIVVGDTLFGYVEMGVQVNDLQLLLDNALWSSLSIAGAEMLLVALFSFALGTYLMQRLGELKRGVEQVGREGPGAQIYVGDNDEVSRVGEAFNTMSRSLAEAKRKIEGEQRQQQHLLEQITELAQVAEHATDSIAILDVTGHVSWTNRAFEQLTGLSKDEIIGQYPLAKLQSADTSESTLRLLSQSIELQKPMRTEIRLQDKFGHDLWVDVSLSPVRDSEGYVERFIYVQRDISERRLLDEQLEQALDRAMRATKAKSEFLANMSHEIRTPMNAIMGISELLMESSSVASEKEQLGLIHQSASNLLQIINDILDYSKIEAGKLTLIEEPFCLNEALESCLDICAYQAECKGLNLILDVPKNINKTVMGDRGRLTQVLLNLVGNAIKFTEQGHVKLSVSCLEYHVTSRITFVVEDTGIGIAEDKLALIMNKFEQVDNSATRDHQGTGLGLAICNRLISMFGGHLSVQSTLGQGSCFKFTVEFPHSLERNNDNVKTPVVSALPRVIYVDSYLPQSQVVTRYLTELGTTVQHVATMDLATRFVFHGESDVDVLVVSASSAQDVEKIAQFSRLYQQQYQKTLPIAIFANHRSVLFDGDNSDEFIYLNVPITRHRLATALECDWAQKREYQRPAIEWSHTEPLSLLLAEDSEVNRMLIEKMLADCPIKVLTAVDGEEAVQLYQQHLPDLVLTDISMPKKDGFEVARIIRELQARHNWPRVPILALSAHAMKEEQSKSLSAGMDAYLTKPIRKADLLRALAQWIEPQKRKPTLWAEERY
uniref:hybrid sensor histidine kinase/response regulator n=1 Tax=Thaumasiovibrio occultus TaxID=1891184 RepID=UPI000B35996A|nr:ATP-binding protein [Thaumasiovibrio occultus]